MKSMTPFFMPFAQNLHKKVNSVKQRAVKKFGFLLGNLTNFLRAFGAKKSSYPVG
jgi:hypothetical protein